MNMRRKAFTLIELLVVIAIIATLISILLPALSMAKESGNLTKCQAALLELGRTATMYSNTNDDSGYGAFPTQPWHLGWNCNGVSVTLISEFIYGGFQTSIPSPDFGTNTDMYKYLTEWRPYTNYMAPGMTGRAPLKNYVCPSDKSNTTPLVGSPTEPIVEDRWSSWQVNGSSYAINWYWYQDPMFNGRRDYGDTPLMHSMGSLMLKQKVGGTAAEFVIFMENTMNSYMYDARPPNGSEGQSLLQKLGVGWHRKFSRYAMGFYDGHADYKFIDTRYTRGANWNIRPGR
jgi:prepilin-type N-terminal cleavage/methylation domain-containing protein